MMVTRRAMLGSCAAIIGTSGLGSRAQAQAERMSVTATHVTSSVNYAPHFVAEAKGFFAEEKLDVKFIVAGTGTKLREVVAANQAQFGLGDSTHPLLLSNRNRASKILLAVDDRSSLCNLVIRKELFDAGIDTIEKLGEWKRPDGSKPVFGVASLGGGSHVYVAYIAEKLGIHDRFVWLAGGSTQTILGQLASGRFDVIGALPNWVIEAEQKNWGRQIFDIRDNKSWNKYFGGPVPSTVAFALQATIDRNPAAVQAYVNGMYRALRWMKTASVDDIYNAIGGKYLTEFTPDVAKQEIEYYKPITNYSGEVDEKQYAHLAPVLFREITGIKDVSYKDGVDTKFIQEAMRKYGA
jgi:NitT/TauT family transport system substrate-binding protein